MASASVGAGSASAPTTHGDNCHCSSPQTNPSTSASPMPCCTVPASASRSRPCPISCATIGDIAMQMPMKPTKNSIHRLAPTATAARSRADRWPARIVSVTPIAMNASCAPTIGHDRRSRGGNSARIAAAVRTDMDGARKRGPHYRPSARPASACPANRAHGPPAAPPGRPCSDRRGLSLRHSTGTWRACRCFRGGASGRGRYRRRIAAGPARRGFATFLGGRLANNAALR